MKNSIIRVALLLLLPVSAQGMTLGQLRSRVNTYMRDGSNLMLSSATKDSIINSAQKEYAAMFPVKVDTAHILLDSAQRIDSMPTNFAGIVLSVHKFNREFTEVKYVPGDSVPQVDRDVPQYFTIRDRMIVVYPPPNKADSLFVFYASQPTALTADSMECRLQDWLEEPLVLLAVSKCWLTGDMRMDLAGAFYQLFETEASRLTRTKIERANP